MSGAAYPDLPLFRVDWSAMTEAAIGAKLGAVADQGPACASPTVQTLAGQGLRIVCDKGTTGGDGPALAYSFASGNRLSLSENGGAAATAGYAALDLGNLTFFAHLLPGTMRGYAVVVDNHTRAATVFELWFGGYDKRKREVMREVYQGYVDVAGQEPSTARHAFNNRLEGAGYYWKQDTGAETLEFYPSIAYTHWVELSRIEDAIGHCAPADYIEIGHGKYIYTRTECEFSGIFTVYAMDVNALRQVGLRLGFNAADELEFQVFRGTGEWLGQIAKYERFDVTDGGPMLPRPGPGQSGAVDVTAKGARAVYRPMENYRTLTSAEVNALVPTHTQVFARRTGAGDGTGGMSTHVTAPSDGLVGKMATVRYDNGPVIDYQFTAVEELKWRMDGGAWTTARYNAWEAIDGVFLMGHALAGTPNHEGHITVLDFVEGKATCYNGYLNTPYIANEAGCRHLFGKLESAGVPDPGTARHDYTTDMLGHCITYSYQPGLTSMHFYSTPGTTSWIIFTPTGAAGLEWSGTGAQVKIRDGLYFLYWIEEACNGTLGTILLNMRTMHDIGIGYHCGTDGLSISPVSALLGHAGQFNVSRFFERRTRG
jgi:MoaF N-terminal domain/MoaF C-terminal domain